jgi:hypothetical protein
MSDSAKGALRDLFATLSDARIKEFLSECPAFRSRALLNAMRDPGRPYHTPREEHIEQALRFVRHCEARFRERGDHLQALLEELRALRAIAVTSAPPRRDVERAARDHDTAAA